MRYPPQDQISPLPLPLYLNIFLLFVFICISLYVFYKICIQIKSWKLYFSVPACLSLFEFQKKKKEYLFIPLPSICLCLKRSFLGGYVNNATNFLDQIIVHLNPLKGFLKERQENGHVMNLLWGELGICVNRKKFACDFSRGLHVFCQIVRNIN